MSFALKQENELPFLSLVEGPMLKVLPGGKAETKPLAEVIPTPSLGGRIIPFHTESRQPLAFRSHEKAINLLSIDSKFIAFSVQGTNPTSCNFDKANRLTRISLEPRASSLKLNCVYDKVSNVTQKKTANGVTLSYVYDALNRLTTKTTPEQTYAFTYDSLSRLIGASNTASNLSFVYDAVSQLLEADTAEVIAS
ncbi:MAG: RHS repeat protein, partial [Chlamydiae bacterium]|nr:RHS repeat protein [Chlamydiota bacterium]